MHVRSTLALSLALVLAPLLGCKPGASRDDAQPATQSAAQPAAAQARQPGAPLVFEPAPEWVVEAPTSSMRKAQYRLPRAQNDTEDGECVVYFFGAMGGGGVEPNVERWCSQFTQPDGRDSMAALVRAERTVAGMPVHEVELPGTYVAETAPGSDVRVNKPGFAMLGAIVESDHGAYYVKLVAPEATLRKHASAFRDFIGRVR